MSLGPWCWRYLAGITKLLARWLTLLRTLEGCRIPGMRTMEKRLEGLEGDIGSDAVETVAKGRKGPCTVVASLILAVYQKLGGI